MMRIVRLRLLVIEIDLSLIAQVRYVLVVLWMALEIIILSADWNGNADGESCSVTISGKQRCQRQCFAVYSSGATYYVG